MGLNEVLDYSSFASGMKSKGAHNKALRESATAMQEGKQGMSTAQKSQLKTGITDDAQRAAQAAVGNVIETSAGAIPGAGLGGSSAKALMGAAGEAAEAGAGAATQIDVASAMQAESRRKETMKALNEQRKESDETISNLMGGLGKAAPALASAVGGSGTAAAALAPMLVALCWTAREVLPNQWRDCRTYVLFGAPKWFRVWYIKNGEQAACWLRLHPRIKTLVRPLFRYFAWRGKRMAQRDPRLLELQSHLA